MKERIRSTLSHQEISSHAAYTFIYSEPLIDFAHPTLSRVVYVGGIGARAAKKVDEVCSDCLKKKNYKIGSLLSIVNHDNWDNREP